LHRPASLIGRCVLRSYLCADWELRVTERCRLEDDLSEVGPLFEDLLQDDIVAQFKKKLAAEPRTARDVSGLGSGRTAWIVQAGGRRRACAWHDEQREVIWLLASHPHTSGADDDSWPHFRELDTAARLFPTGVDFQLLEEEEPARFYEALMVEAPGLIAAAQTHDGVEQRTTLVDRYGVGLAISVVETTEERVLAVATEKREEVFRRLRVILVAFGFETIPEAAIRIGGREIDPANELGFRMDIEH